MDMNILTPRCCFPEIVEFQLLFFCNVDYFRQNNIILKLSFDFIICGK